MTMIGKVNQTQVQQPKKMSTAKRVAVATASTVGTAAVAAGTVLVLAKKGKFNPTEGGNKYLEQAKSVVRNVADKVFAKVDAGVAAATQKVNVAKAHYSAKNNYKVTDFESKVDYAKNFTKSTVQTLKNNAEYLWAKAKLHFPH